MGMCPPGIPGAARGSKKQDDAGTGDKSGSFLPSLIAVPLRKKKKGDVL